MSPMTEPGSRFEVAAPESGEPFVPYVEAGVPDSVYHADKRTLSSSEARRVLESPSRYRWEKDHERPYNAAFEVGHAAHTMLLGAGSDWVIVEEASWRSKAAREARDQALRDGKNPVLRSDFDVVKAMADRMLEHPLCGRLFTRDDAYPELSMYWDGDGLGGPVPCRARPDLTVGEDVPEVLVDYKTTADASPDGFAKSVARYGYHMQQEWYRDACEALYGARPGFVFVVQEKAPPYDVGVYTLDDTAAELGRRMNSVARGVWEWCVRHGSWPSPFKPEPVTVSLPAWEESRLREEYL